MLPFGDLATDPLPGAGQIVQAFRIQGADLPGGFGQGVRAMLAYEDIRRRPDGVFQELIFRQGNRSYGVNNLPKNKRDKELNSGKTLTWQGGFGVSARWPRTWFGPMPSVRSRGPRRRRFCRTERPG